MFDPAELIALLQGANTFVSTYTRATVPFIVNAQNNLVNSFHEVLGRAGYLPPGTATTEGQGVAVKSSCEAYLVTGDVAWLNRAVAMANSLMFYFYKVPLSTNPANFWVPHWVLNIRGSFFTKGRIAESFENNGYFDQTITFTNGLGVIPSGGVTNGERTSDVYRVYSTNGSLLWQNIYSTVRTGTNYEIDYWVTDFMMTGVRYRLYPTMLLAVPTPTNETVGTIKLKTNFTGSARLVYMAYTTDLVGENQMFEAFPGWRRLDTTEYNVAWDTQPWIYDAYRLLSEIQPENPPGTPTIWATAKDAARNNAIANAVVDNIAYWYKKGTNSDPFSYPGSQIVKVNNAGTIVSFRDVLPSIFAQFLRLTVPASPGTFPSVEVQNFAVQAEFNAATTVYVECGVSVATILEIVVSTASNAFDFSQLYKAYLKVDTPNAIVSQTFAADSFVRWDSPTTVWHPRSGDNPVYVYSGAGAIATATVEVENTRLHYSLTLRASNTFAGAGLVLLQTIPTQPPFIRYRLDGPDVIMRIRASNDGLWDAPIPERGIWRTLKLAWSDFEWSPNNAFENRSPPNPLTPAVGGIKNIEFVSTSSETSVLDLRWVTRDGEPDRLPMPSRTFKASLVSKVAVAHTFWCGDFRPIGSRLDKLSYNPGVVPFTVNVINGAVDAWRGIPMTGYQDPAFWRSLGLEDRASQAVTFIADAQIAYRLQHFQGKDGPFAPAYSWAYWDSADYDLNGLNQFGWEAPDPNSQWAPYSFRALKAIASAWFQLPTDTLARTTTMKFITFLDNFYTSRNSIQPITDFPEFVDAQVNYHEPHVAALVMKAAIYANLAGGSPAITRRVILKSFEYIKSQYVASGNMLGSFAAGQPTFVSGGVTYREYFGFWHFEIIEALSLALKYNNSFRSPANPDIPILDLAVQWNYNFNAEVQESTVNLGDGYTQDAVIGVESGVMWRESLEVTAILDTAQKTALEGLMRAWNGVQIFQWQPKPNVDIRLYKCIPWSFTQLAVDTWEFSGTFTTGEAIPDGLSGLDF